ncbi:MAG: DUF4332 domain-containing protein [Leptolyngbya sp. SIO1D8]|nr:DUF4332 domain-containing protein [Leptolyngbya sp. SIO1D8]
MLMSLTCDAEVNAAMSLKLQIWPLSQLPGVSHEQVVQLQTLGLNTTEDLLAQTRAPHELQGIAKKLQIPLRYPKKWVILAELSQLPSIGCQYCGLLLHSGISSISQLAIAAPGRLYNQLRRLHTATLRRSDLCPTPDQVVCWVQEAKQFLRSR